MTDQNTIPSNEQHAEEDEIDLLKVAKNLWRQRRTIFIIIGAFLVLGLVVALFSPEKYHVTTVMVPQQGSSGVNLGGLSGLASMAGVSVPRGEAGDQLSPFIYPKIVESVPFRKELMYTKLKFEDYDEKIRLIDYYTDPQYRTFNLIGTIKRYTIGLPGVIIGVFSRQEADTLMLEEGDEDMLLLTEAEYRMAKKLSNKVYLNINEEGFDISLVAIMGEPKATAQLAKKAKALLEERITEIKIEKAKDELKFVKQNFEDKKEEYKKAQARLAKFRNSNQNISNAMARAEEQRLQAEYQLAFNVYSELAKQYENAKIKVKEDTPVFSVIKPVQVPNESYEPRRVRIMIIFLFLGIILGAGFVLAKDYYRKLKVEWQEK